MAVRQIIGGARGAKRVSNDVLLGEVARVLGISRSTAWARAIRGDIPSEIRGGRFIVHRRVLNRLAAAQALAAIGTDIAVISLETATRDPFADVRVVAWSGLAGMPDTPSLRCFSDALTDEFDPLVQRALLLCLAEHPHPMAIALLVRFCARLVSSPRHGNIVCDALELLAEHRPGNVQLLLRRLQDMDTPATRSRVEALRHLCTST